MLVAEIHGKVVPEAQNSEDYLTSSVLGHLRYISPSVFWPQLFALTKGHDDNSQGLLEHLGAVGISIGDFTQLKTFFWQKHRTLGEPDAVLRFEGDDQPSLNMLIEAKLSSNKSGHGEKDQLGRYVRVMNDVQSIDVSAGPDDHSVLVYLTAKDSQREVEETLRDSEDAARRKDRIFRMRWQDVLKACHLELNSKTLTPLERQILKDVKAFLIRRRLEYFEGFKRIEKFTFRIAPRSFFAGTFRRSDGLPTIRLRNCGWTT